MNFVALLSLLAAFLSIALGTFVLSRDHRSPLNRVTMLLTLAVGWSAFAEFEFRQATNFDEAMVWLRLASAWPFVFALIAHFILILTEAGRRWLHPVSLALLYGSAITLAIVDVTTDQLSGVPFEVWYGWSWDYPETWGVALYVAGYWVHVLSLFGMYRLITYFLRVRDHRRRQQAKYVLIGTAIPLVTFEMSVGILPLYGVDIPSFALVTYSVGLGFFAYAIWRYQLFTLTIPAVANEMLSTISDSLILVTMDERISEVNLATLRLTQYERDDLIGQPLGMILSENGSHNGPSGTSRTEDGATAGRGTVVETALKTREGGSVPLSLSISVLRAHDGERLGIVYVGRDLSERKWAEEELRKANDALEDRVRERTAELTATSETLKAEITGRKRLEQQLYQAQKLEALGTLAGGVAHDFNNILSAIMGFTYLGQIDSVSEDVLRGYFVDIHKSSERAASLTRQLLAFSRRQAVEPVVFDLNVLVFDLYKMLSRLIGEEIELASLVRDSKNAYIRADPGQIEQVIINLVVNARDAMPKGGRIQISSGLVTVDEANATEFLGKTPGDYVRLIVSDNGVGMTESIKERIFDPFFTTKEVGKGTGLGLSTCYGIATQNNGFIQVDTTPGGGTSFYVYLPFVEYDAFQAASLDGDMLPRGTETVLIVEDEKTVRDTAVMILRDRGYEVLEASNGREALQVIKQSNGAPIDVVVTDMVMPVMGGRELAAHLGQGHPQTKIVFMSGYSGEPTEDGVDQQLLSDLIEKPFTAEALTRKIRDVLDGGPS